MFTRVKTQSELASMRQSGRMLATVLSVLSRKAVPGMSTKDLADIAKKELRSLGGQPTFLGYYDFPDVLCVSVNDEVVHGIPRTDKILRDGDVVSLDFGVTYDGMITDAARTIIIGMTKQKRTAELVAATESSLEAGIAVLRDGVRTGDIGSAVEASLRPGKYGIVRDLVGHGVGHELHEEPNVPNYGRAGHGSALKAGMTIAIEPMVTLGTHKVYVNQDGWTIHTQDGSLSAHFEDTVLITHDGAEVLTKI